MPAECNQFVFGFHPQKRREIRAQFDGGAITSDGGGLLLREVEKRIGILHRFAACFTDYRNPDLIEHPVKQIVLTEISICIPSARKPMITSIRDTSRRLSRRKPPPVISALSRRSLAASTPARTMPPTGLSRASSSQKH
jgi:hypothetical protein